MQPEEEPRVQSLEMESLQKQLEYFFTPENLKNDSFLLRNINSLGYVKLEIMAKFRKVKNFTDKISDIIDAVQASDKLALNDEKTMMKSNEILADSFLIPGKLSRIVIAYNLAKNSTEDSLRKLFVTCGKIQSIILITDGEQESSLVKGIKPPTSCTGPYAVVEFLEESIARQAVLSLSDESNLSTGMQVVLHDGTSAEKIKKSIQSTESEQSEFPAPSDRRRAQSMITPSFRPVHVDAVGEGMDDLKDGRTAQGTVSSVRGTGGLITPEKYPQASISFRILSNGTDDSNKVKSGDKVTFIVGKNKKTGRKYASRVRIQMETQSEDAPSSDDWISSRRRAATISGSTPPLLRKRMDSPPELRTKLAINPEIPVPKKESLLPEKDYFSFSENSWSSRRRSATLGGSQSDIPNKALGSLDTPIFRIPEHEKEIPEVDTLSPRMAGSVGYRQAKGPDGTLGFHQGRGTKEPEVFNAFNPLFSRRRAASTGNNFTQPLMAMVNEVN